MTGHEVKRRIGGKSSADSEQNYWTFTRKKIVWEEKVVCVLCMCMWVRDFVDIVVDGYNGHSEAHSVRWLMVDRTWVTKLAFALSVERRKRKWGKSVFVGYFLLESTVEMTSISRPNCTIPCCSMYFWSWVFFSFSFSFFSHSMSSTQSACQWLFRSSCSILVWKKFFVSLVIVSEKVCWYLSSWCVGVRRKRKKRVKKANKEEEVIACSCQSKKQNSYTMTKMTSE